VRISIYARVSTDKQECDNQLLQLREFAAKQGWVVAAEYVDSGVSGSKSDRVELQRMFHDASQHKFDCLLFWALDRLSREGVLPTLQHLNRLDSYGVAIPELHGALFRFLRRVQRRDSRHYGYPGKAGADQTVRAHKGRTGSRQSVRQNARASQKYFGEPVSGRWAAGRGSVTAGGRTSTWHFGTDCATARCGVNEPFCRFRSCNTT
jgi:hypothetical protein